MILALNAICGSVDYNLTCSPLKLTSHNWRASKNTLGYYDVKTGLAVSKTSDHVSLVMVMVYHG